MNKIVCTFIAGPYSALGKGGGLLIWNRNFWLIYIMSMIKKNRKDNINLAPQSDFRRKDEFEEIESNK